MMLKMQIETFLWLTLYQNYIIFFSKIFFCIFLHASNNKYVSIKHKFDQLFEMRYCGVLLYFVTYEIILPFLSSFQPSQPSVGER